MTRPEAATRTHASTVYRKLERKASLRTRSRLLALSEMEAPDQTIKRSRTHSAILLPNSRLDGCELAVKMTRPPLVWFMSLGFGPLVSTHSGRGSRGTHAALSPSYTTDRGRSKDFVSAQQNDSSRLSGSSAAARMKRPPT